jgi:hypothetical protein
MNYDNDVGPIGNLKNCNELLDYLNKTIAAKQLPVITCKNEKCRCGLCAPKSINKDELITAFKKYTTTNVFQE